MPEYLAPGAYVEETSARARSIQGLSTSTAGFVGPTIKGPTKGAPLLITSFASFERVFGGIENLQLGADEVTNYIAHAVRNYFDNGGARLFVARVYNPTGDRDGRALSNIAGDDPNDGNDLRFRAQFPGRSGNGSVTVSLVSTSASQNSVDQAPIGSLMIDDTTLYL